MTRLLLGAGVLALVLPVAGATPSAAQEECTCLDGGGRFLSIDGPGNFSVWGGSRARIGIGFSSDEQDGFLDVGAVVTQVTDDGPADEAGLEEGDVIVAVDGHELMEPLDRQLERFIDEDGSVPVQRLLALARDWEVGESVHLTVLREGGEMEFEVVPEDRAFDFEPLRLRMDELGNSFEQLAPLYERSLRNRDREGVRSPRAPRVRVWSGEGGDFDFAFGDGAYGLELTELNPQLGSYFGTETGVLVTDVADESTLGLEPGDVILEIGDRDVRQPRDVRRILNSYDDDEEVRIRVRRQGETQTVTGTTR